MNPLEIIKKFSDKKSTVGTIQDRKKYNDYVITEQESGRKPKPFKDWQGGK